MNRVLLFFPVAVLCSCSDIHISRKEGTVDLNPGWRFAICAGTANLETPATVFEESDSLAVPYGCALPLKEDGSSLLALSEGPSDSPELAGMNFCDRKWRRVNLPHDWAIEGDFNRHNLSGTGGGALPGGIGWYRKSFHASRGLAGKKVFLEFDGVYMNSTVWVNGNELGTRPYGYISFSYDISDFIRPGRRNTIAVRVNNSDQPNSRWYSGCGIFRNVRMRIAGTVSIPQWGIFARCENEEELKVCVDIFRDESAPADSVDVISELIDRDGSVISYSINSVGPDMVCEQILSLYNPHLWSLRDPYLYDLRTRLLSRNGRVLDERHTPTGIRTIVFDARDGFRLNGERVKINGVCLHHDLGALGSAVNRSALKRQLTIMKEMGVNSVRCSHNPPSVELLDLCDEMGLLVLDEAFDMWRQRKTERDYARFFDQWHEKDLADFVIRDRNHPSVFMWSIGNEVLEQWSNASADTLSLEEANFILNFGHGEDQLAAEGEMSVNSLLTAKLADIVRSLDPTRPITSGCNEPSPGNHLLRSGALDVIGYNYHDTWFKDVPENFRGKPFIVTESVSPLMTRGFYTMPSDVEKICPPLWDNPRLEPSFACSSYDQFHVPWGTTNEHTLSLVEHNDFISGQYIWTGFDYIGEPIPYGWPARSSYFGIVDLAGFPKDVYYMYQSVWRKDIDVLHLLPHWNWKEGDTVDVWVYYNNFDCVELFVNGKSCGTRKKISYEDIESGKLPAENIFDMSTEYHCCWRVPFEAGELTVAAYRSGERVAEKTIHTAGTPSSLDLCADRDEIAADRSEMAFVSVEVLDKDGNLCPLADDDIKFTVSGPGEIAGVDNGSPITLERFKSDHRKAFYGKCLVIVRSTGKPGRIMVHAESRDGSLAGEYVVKAE